ncbi:ABC transporter permease [Enterococcus xiangfangensis]|uniref:ABC transporter permease n=1 Tax=Enterococcus xiangfangensis TaxID=1296537 RepID=A0ABU3F792_9ENTE|nr:ABC transporter permease [Enterococcus xiangfangensis]MBM7710740.1 ABC-2 type transport system permease protein [Enterococcus xiangfangensis]MDT2758516.1 ABC transporter permease [Enterococcus xiangfangensis]NBK08186.1 ABC transporter permease [Enterococcus asini]
MKDILWIIRERFIIWKSHPLQVLFLLGVPLLSIVMYLFIYNSSGTGSANTLSVGIVDRDQSTYSQSFIDEFDKRVQVKELKNQKQADKAMADQQITATLILPENFSEKIRHEELAKISFRSFQAGEAIDSLKATAKTVYNEVQTIAGFAAVSSEEAAFDFAKENTPIHFRSFKKDGVSQEMTLQILGFMLMMLLYQSGNFGANSIQNERRNKIYQRLMTTPVSKTAYFVGTAVFAFLAMVFEVVFTVGLMTLAFRIDIGLAAIQLIGVLSAFGLVAVAWSIAIGINSPSQSFASGVQSILFTITSLISGALIPNEIMPDFMQQIARITPQYWVLDSIKQLQSQGDADVLINFVVLSAFLLLFFSISAYGFMKKKNLEVFD